MAKSTIILDVRYKSKDGKYPLVLRIKHNYTSTTLQLPHRIKPLDWDGSKIKKSCDYYNVQQENFNIIDFQQNFDNFLLKLMNDENIKAYSAKELKQMFVAERTRKGIAFFEQLFDTHIENKMQNNPGAKTHQSYSNTKNLLIEFSGSDIKINNVDKAFIEKFELFLKNKNHKINTIALHMRNIRAVYNYGISIGAADVHQYPFRHYKITRQKTMHRTVVPSDLIRIFNYSGSDTEQRSIDLFKLSFYLIGINFKDMLYAKTSDIYNGRLYYRRAKTDKQISVKILPEAQVIIDKYKGHKHMLKFMDYKLRHAKANRSTHIHTDIIRNVNKHLKDVCKNLDINVNLSTYYARHTWATIARKCGVQFDVIHNALGHSNSDVTAIYVEYDSDMIDEANLNVINFVNKQVLS